MKRYLYLSLMAIGVAVGSCKKSETPAPAGPDAASLNIENELETGTGTWHVDAVNDTLYDANNKAVYSINLSEPSYWVFKKAYWTPWQGTFLVENYRLLSDPSTLNSYSYTFSFSNGNTYIVVSGSSKNQITVLNSTRMVWVSAPTDLTYPTGPGTYGTAAYGTSSAHFSKYN